MEVNKPLVDLDGVFQCLLVGGLRGHLKRTLAQLRLRCLHVLYHAGVVNKSDGFQELSKDKFCLKFNTRQTVHLNNVGDDWTKQRHWCRPSRPQ